MYNACVILSKKTNGSIFLKGGELEGELGIDVLYEKGEFTKFNYRKINTNNTHGTGCTFSSAVEFYLGNGISINDSIKRAKKYLKKTIMNAPKLGVIYGPLGH